MVQFIRKHSKEGEIDMKHLIIVKFKENVWARESEASREMLADIREIFDRTQQIEGVHTVNIYENVTPRPNRHDLMIGLSLSGTKSEILYMLDRGFQQGARTMLITGKNRQTYEDFCNEILLVPSLQHLNHGNLISPQFPLLLMIDILYAAYVNDDRMRIEKIQRDVQRTLRGNEDR